MIVLTQGTKTNKPDIVGIAWKQRADQLARWAMARLANRYDVWGLYHHWVDPEGVEHHVRTAPWRRDRGRLSLTDQTLRLHFADPGDGRTVGLHSTSPDGKCKWFALDVDRHSDDDPTPRDTYMAAALAWAEELQRLGFHPIVEDSGGGFHVVVLLDVAAQVEDVFAFVDQLASSWEDKGLRGPVETYPKQASIGSGFGNWLRVAGQHHRRRTWTAVYDFGRGEWVHGNQAIDLLIGADVSAAALIPLAPVPEPPPLGETPTPPSTPRTRGVIYRGKCVSADVIGANTGSVGIRLGFKLSEREDGGQWMPTVEPLTAYGDFYLILPTGEAVAAVEDMFAESLDRQAIIDDILNGDDLTSLHRRCQAVVESGINGPTVEWLRRYDAAGSWLDSYLAKLPSGLRAGDHRSDVAYIFAAAMVNNAGMTDADALPWLQAWNARQAEPLPDAKLVDTLKNARQYGDPSKAKGGRQHG